MKPASLISSLFFCLSLLVYGASESRAADKITPRMVEAKYKEMEKALNSREDYVEAVKVLHEQISDDARFRMTVTNPVSGQAGESPVLEMDKQDYINTYLQGTHQVSDYHLNIKTADFKYDPERNAAFTVDILTETGTVPALNNGSKPFISRTKCLTRHEMRGGELKATSSDCHTDVSFEEEI